MYGDTYSVQSQVWLLYHHLPETERNENAKWNGHTLMELLSAKTPFPSQEILEHKDYEPASGRENEISTRTSDRLFALLLPADMVQ